MSNPDVYRKRLKNIGFEGLEKVLDAGCGFGQWTSEIAFLNKHVTALEYDPLRLECAKKITKFLDKKNIEFVEGNTERLNLNDNSYDAIFSYSVVYLTNYQDSLREFHRVLKPGGMLYFSTNGLGWYLHNLLDTHNDASDYSSRKMAIDALLNTIRYYASGACDPKKQIIMTKDIIIPFLDNVGFEIIEIGPDASTSLDKISELVKPFYQESYYGQESVWEAICRKK